jgi:ubiquinone/menaquinone biosynthesis C-methylase UbiE
VTALDLERPAWEAPGIRTVAGNACNLEFRDESFDCMLCSEVIEHIPEVERACRELARVARHEVIVGVPYRQDLRLGQMPCRSCGKINPAYRARQPF